MVRDRLVWHSRLPLPCFGCQWCEVVVEEGGEGRGDGIGKWSVWSDSNRPLTCHMHIL